MKHLLILSLIVIPFLSTCFAQTANDSITIDRKSYVYKGQKLTMKGLSNIMKSNPEANKEFRKAKSNAAGATVFGSIGGFMIGWPLGSAIGGGDPNWAIAGIGLGVTLISIPFSVNANKHANNAVNIYNRDVGKTGNVDKVEYYFQVNNSGIGVKMVF